MEVLLTVLFLCGLYFVPWIVAAANRAPNTGTIAVINIFLGWTVIAWVVALAMACADNKKGNQ